ncbi:hypothetical protein LCGC14_3060580, partial [marine sediment metagenome]
LKTSHIFVALTISVESSLANKDGRFAININGVDHDVIVRSFDSTDKGSIVVFARTTTPLAPGTYTVKGRWAIEPTATLLSSVDDIMITAIGLESSLQTYNLNIADNIALAESYLATSTFLRSLIDNLSIRPNF